MSDESASLGDRRVPTGDFLRRFEGVPTFLDVEGMPDRDFYYLVGLRFESGGEAVERSFWADGLDGDAGSECGPEPAGDHACGEQRHAGNQTKEAERRWILKC